MRTYNLMGNTGFVLFILLSLVACKSTQRYKTSQKTGFPRNFRELQNQSYSMSSPDDITDQMLEFHKGSFDKFISSEKFKKPNKDIIDRLMSGSAPMDLKINRESKSIGFDMSKINMCTGDKEDYFATLFNQSGLEARKAMMTIYTSCLVSVESLGYVSSGKMRRFWNELHVDGRENGSGTLGFGQLDKNAKEGSQRFCKSTFEKWGMNDSCAGKGSCPAAQKDQYFNVACTTYLAMSNWVNSYTKNGNTCAKVVPSRSAGMSTHDVEHGPILFRKPDFIGCLKNATNPKAISLITRSMGYNLNGADERRLLSLALSHENSNMN